MSYFHMKTMPPMKTFDCFKYQNFDSLQLCSPSKNIDKWYNLEASNLTLLEPGVHGVAGLLELKTLC